MTARIISGLFFLQVIGLLLWFGGRFRTRRRQRRHVLEVWLRLDGAWPNSMSELMLRDELRFMAARRTEGERLAASRETVLQTENSSDI